MKKIKVRFAPSPTGFLHVGGARTALFNYLFAKSRDGEFVLRIEDTDLKRSTEEMVDVILEGLKWMGIEWDHGPFYQTDNFDLYREKAQELLKNSYVYRCFCTEKDIEERKLKSKEDIHKYDRHCLCLSDSEVNEKLRNGDPYVLRFRVPEGKLKFKDRFHKEIGIDLSELEDFVILKSDNTPTYHLSVVVDDWTMGITDVIRGDDHISNTFKQILLFRAFDVKPPKYGHLPLVLGNDKKKLSKRHGETSILSFRDRGYLSESLNTYLSQLTWMNPDEKVVYNMEQLTDKFSLEKVSKNNPVFDYKKLDFLNSKALNQSSVDYLYEILGKRDDFKRDFSDIDDKRFKDFIGIIVSRMDNLDFLMKQAYIYLKNKVNYENAANDLNPEFLNRENISGMRRALAGCNFDSSEEIEHIVRKCADEAGIKAATLIHPLRYAVVGGKVSPSVFEVLFFMGKEETLKRVDNFIEFSGFNKQR